MREAASSRIDDGTAAARSSCAGSEPSGNRGPFRAADGGSPAALLETHGLRQARIGEPRHDPERGLDDGVAGQGRRNRGDE
ncbi:MAG: hypothetical protein DME03_05425 [Candidatus Rokuibacteriota bacterium]|nr:MAG: hypothetical protein DME03_05425 [Candidatus Rokubacteria bacterium]